MGTLDKRVIYVQGQREIHHAIQNSKQFKKLKNCLRLEFSLNIFGPKLTMESKRMGKEDSSSLFHCLSSCGLLHLCLCDREKRYR
jgi:hypothetical protein